MTVERLRGDTQQEKPNRDFDQADSVQIERLRDEVEFIAVGKVYRVDVLYVSATAESYFRNDENLAGEALLFCQCCSSASDSFLVADKNTEIS